MDEGGGVKVMLAVPCYTGELKPAMGQALLRGQAEITERWGAPRLYVHSNCSIITRARNAILAHFLASDCDVMVTLDDDIAWDGDELIRLLEHDGDFVAGVYRSKEEPPKYHCQLADPHADLDRPLIDANRVPAGFLKLSRACVQRMTEVYGHLAYFEPHVPGRQAHDLFAFVVEDGTFWGEDYTFCKRWKAIGGRIWVDHNLTLHHIGRAPERCDDGLFRLEEKVFTGNYGAWLRAERSKATWTT